LGNALSDSGRLPEAISHYKAALRINADNAQAQNGLGAALFHSGDIAAAIGHFERALKLRPEFAEAHYNLGNALARLGRSDESSHNIARRCGCVRLGGTALFPGRRPGQRWPIARGHRGI